MQPDKLNEAITALKAAPSISIHGKDYTQVATRVEVFRKHFGLAYGITTAVLDSTEPYVRVRAEIIDGAGKVVASGLAEENRNYGNINKTSAMENCETSAIGRALAAFGLHGGEYASAGEVSNAIAQQQQAWRGPLKKTALKGKLRELSAVLQQAKTAEDVDAVSGAYKEVLEQTYHDMRDWWDAAQEAIVNRRDACRNMEVV